MLRYSFGLKLIRLPKNFDHFSILFRPFLSEIIEIFERRRRATEGPEADLPMAAAKVCVGAVTNVEKSCSS